MISKGLPLSELEQLGESIRAGTDDLSKFISEIRYAQPSSNGEAPTKVLPTDAPVEIHLIRQKLKQDALKLFRLVSGPEEYLQHIALNHQYASALRYLNYFKIFQAIPKQASISISNLSVITNAPLPLLTEVLKFASTSGLFAFPQPGRVAHNATSRLLATNDKFSSWTEFISTYLHDASVELPKASARWRDSSDPTHSAFNMANNAQLAFPEHLRQNPVLAGTMSKFVQATAQLDANSIRHLIRGFDWTPYKQNTTVVEIGSRSCYPMLEMAQELPALRFELQTTPDQAANLEAVKNSLPPVMAKRFTIKATQSMFEPQIRSAEDSADPLPQKRVYLLRHVLHNLPIVPAARILGKIIDALGAEDRIIVNDLVLPEQGELDPYEEGMIRMRDMIQRTLSNGSVKTLREWTKIVELANAKARIISVFRPYGSDLSTIEIAR